MDSGGVDKASNEAINETYAEYKQRQLNEKTGRAIGKHVIRLYSTSLSQVPKIGDVKTLQQNIENDPIIKDQMSNLGCLLVCTFDYFLVRVSVAAHIVNTLGLRHEQSVENKGYESD